MLVIGQVALVRLWLLLQASTALDDIDIRLFKSDTQPSPLTVPGDFTEADFTGYAAQPVAFNVAWDDTAGNAIIWTPSVIFAPSGTAVTNVIYGWYATAALGGTGDVVVACERFPSPAAIASIEDAVIVSPLLANNQPVDLSTI